MTHPPDSPIRVMRIIARLNTGGPAIHVSLLSRGLDADGCFKTRLVAGLIGEAEGDMSYLARESGLDLITLPALGREISPFADFMTTLALFRLMRRWRPHIVHTHTAKAGFVGRLAAWLAGVPVIVHTFHGHVFHSYFGPLTTQLFLILERLAALISTAILTVSDGLRDELLGYHIAPPHKIRVVPLGLDLAPFTHAETLRGRFRRELGISTDAPLVGIIGRLVPVKHHDLFLAAARLVLDTVPDACFVVVGDGQRRAELVSLVGEMGLAGRVIFTGWRRDLPRIYADLGALVISSKNEGTPVSLIEAMAAGVPVVSTAVGGVPDLLKRGDLGLLVPPGDPSALAAGIVAALARPSADRIGRAREQVLRYHSADRLTADIRALYLELLAGKGLNPEHD